MLIDLKNNYYEAIKMLTGLKDDELGRIFKFSNENLSYDLDIDEVQVQEILKNRDALDILLNSDILGYHYTTADFEELNKYGLQNLRGVLNRDSELKLFLKENGIVIELDEQYIQCGTERLVFSGECSNTNEGVLVNRFSDDYKICIFASEEEEGIYRYNRRISEAPEIISTIERVWPEKCIGLVERWKNDDKHELKRITVKIPVKETNLINTPEDTLDKLLHIALDNYRKCNMNSQVIAEINRDVIGREEIEDIVSFSSLEDEEKKKNYELSRNYIKAREELLGIDGEE
ncbi:MAG: hypothetical protein ACIRXY_05905 [Ligilactobacillus animalis]|uniref:hypothetical protein n=1 Tax=Ligilactobacillus animalis TaxID=1605 RepID=UPI0029434CF2|nr:hypothetical protein [Ligilactobacillus animalis]